MYTMKDVCLKFDFPYETLRFYCNEGLIPNVKRDANNYRVFDDRDIAWIDGLQCLRQCGLSIKELKVYLELSMEGKSTIPTRKEMLAKRKEALLRQLGDIQESIDYIDKKQRYFDDVLAGKIPFSSNLIKVDDKEV
ncbi:MAG: transcriptional regulator [Firmicutes bacterium GWF2_51_9]|nr:MAG: transcriptional regulator [Firmicutes bacterium GWF2_51_9]OGS58396.1 MAG: transcriptional regulator [Firmicutes bacterium GWE2_51_13]HAM63369.1 MerR family transcriptional regulator [Erysipelotrichaceae bacterium]HAO62342.1 MerR family transcriptional regulator [Erysipelotrichaceae bacterium]HBZ40933.1 MerR family transcriptional regulator [Erysipelotrichaceae bacterium]